MSGAGKVLCDFCDEPAVAVSTEGQPKTRRARCQDHRVIGGNKFQMAREHRGRPENDWIRDHNLDLDNEVMAELRRRNGTGAP